MFSSLKRLWHGEANGVLTGATIIGFASLASRGVGLLRDRVLAGAFGVGPELDAYYAAFRIPDTMYNLLIAGALTAGFIPVFTTWMEKRGQAKAWELAGKIFSTVAVTLVFACALCFIFAPTIVPFTVPGFSVSSTHLVVHLTRIMLISPILLGMSAVMGGVLQSLRRFTAFSLAPVLYNIGIILGTLVLAPIMGISGVAWGVVIGALAHAVTQWSVASSLGFRIWFSPSFGDPGVREIARLAAPRAAGLAVTQINLILLLILASSLPSGSVAILNFATNVQFLPVGLIGISFAVSAFPALSTYWSQNNQNGFAHVIEKTSRQMFFCLLPISVLFIVFRAEIISLILGNGKFGVDDASQTARVLVLFTLSLIPQSLVPLLARAFYATHSTWRPFLIGLLAEIANIGTALALRPTLGIAGLAIAFTVSAWVQCILYYWFLRRVTDLRSKNLATAFGKSFVAAFVMVVVWAVIDSLVPRSSSLLVFLGFSMVLVFIYLFVSWALRSEELRSFTLPKFAKDG